MMTETVVHVTTLEQWKSVLDVWFKNGYSWYSGDQRYHEEYFNIGIRELLLDKDNDILITTLEKREPISYKEFMAQQKEDNKMSTYYVTQEQLDLINDLKESDFPVYNFYGSNKYQPLAVANKLSSKAEKMLLRYLGGDTSVEFKVKEPLYRLWRDELDNDIVYMTLNNFGTPNWTMGKENAFTAPLEEIKKWQTPAWEIEKAD